MEKLYTVMENKTWSQLWLRSSALIAKFRLKLKKVWKITRSFRYDLNKIPYDYTVELMNRFKGLDLVDRVPEELRTEVHNIVQELVTKIILKKKKCNKAKWLSEEALQIAEKREAKGKRIEKVDPSEYQVSKNSKERFKKKNLSKLSMQSNRGKK